MTSNYIPDETRYNFYHAIHKALRLGHCRMLPALSALDYRDAARTKAVMADLRNLLAVARGHLEGENREIHAALEERLPGAASHAAEDHEGHEASFVDLEELILKVEQAPMAGRELAGRRLYKRYAVFAAHDLEHMHVEETELLAALHEAFTDQELMAIESRIVAAAPPQKLAAVMMLMAPALNHEERVELLSKLQKAMPGPAFEGLLATAIKPSLAIRDYSAVIGELMLRAA
ncbi:hypothetical protein [Aestuariivirga sp.]|uniref:hypothetical protein n=1 Tax=Aestuariivirga sp. TaxID=2650926 RepID=UPI003BACD62A